MPRPETGMTTVKWTIAAVGAAAIVGAAWVVAASLSRKSDTDSTLPNELQLAASQPKAENPREMYSAVRELMRREDLTDEQRRELRRNIRELRDQRTNERVDEFFAATPEKREELLDRHLDEFQQRRQQWQAEREKRASEREAGGAQAERRTKGDGRGRSEAGQSRRGRGRGRKSSQSERKMRSESRDPDQRARRMAYRTALQTRARERGMDVSFGHGTGEVAADPDTPHRIPRFLMD